MLDSWSFPIFLAERQDGDMDWVAAYAAVVATASAAWQGYVWYQTRRVRVKVELVPDPLSAGMSVKFGNLTYGYPNYGIPKIDAVRVRIVNRGDQTIYVSRISVQGVGVETNRGPIERSPPTEMISSKQAQELAIPIEDLKRFGISPYKTMLAEVTLDSGERVRSSPTQVFPRPNVKDIRRKIERDQATTDLSRFGDPPDPPAYYRAVGPDGLFIYISLFTEKEVEYHKPRSFEARATAMGWRDGSAVIVPSEVSWEYRELNRSRYMRGYVLCRIQGWRWVVRRSFSSRRAWVRRSWIESCTPITEAEYDDARRRGWILIDDEYREVAGEDD